MNGSEEIQQAAEVQTPVEYQREGFKVRSERGRVELRWGCSSSGRRWVIVFGSAAIASLAMLVCFWPSGGGVFVTVLVVSVVGACAGLGGPLFLRETAAVFDRSGLRWGTPLGFRLSAEPEPVQPVRVHIGVGWRGPGDATPHEQAELVLTVLGPDESVVGVAVLTRADVNALHAAFASAALDGVVLVHESGPGRPHPSRLCVTCGYDLIGLNGVRCPECGELLSEETRRLLRSLAANTGVSKPDAAGELTLRP